MKTYNLRISRPSPSMNDDKEIIQAVDYADAVEQARSAWRATGRRVSLSSGEYGIYVWHYITSAGNAIDRNTNSGIPLKSQLVR